jgi:hypothetical protein
MFPATESQFGFILAIKKGTSRQPVNRLLSPSMTSEMFRLDAVLPVLHSIVQ